MPGNLVFPASFRFLGAGPALQASGPGNSRSARKFVIDDLGRQPQSVPADTFACLESATDKVIVAASDRTQRYEATVGANPVFEARNASFLTSETSHGIILIDGDDSTPGMCWAGGYVWGEKPPDASRADSGNWCASDA